MGAIKGVADADQGNDHLLEGWAFLWVKKRQNDIGLS